MNRDIFSIYFNHRDDKVHPTQYFVVCENEVLSETTDFIKALIALYAWYYVIDIEYPKLCRST